MPVRAPFRASARLSALLSILLLSLLGSCGNKGDLYLPGSIDDERALDDIDRAIELSDGGRSDDPSAEERRERERRAARAAQQRQGRS